MHTLIWHVCVKAKLELHMHMRQQQQTVLTTPLVPKTLLCPPANRGQSARLPRRDPVQRSATVAPCPARPASKQLAC